MKKRSYIFALAALTASLMLAGCNDKKQDSAESTENADAENAGESSGKSEEDPDNPLDFNPSDYVKLGDYKGLEVTYPAVLAVKDEDVKTEIEYALDDNTEYREVKDRGAQDGDSINIDFKGTIDGEEFEGGSAAEYELELGAGEFLEAFEENLIGKKAGENVVFKMTFPEEYDDELVGKEAEFTVTVNSISEAVRPEYNAEFVKSISDYKTVEEYEASIRAQLEEDAKYDSESEAGENALALAIENAVVEGYPQKLYDYFYEDTVTGYKNYAELMGMEYEEFLEGFMTEEDIKAATEEQVNEYLVVQAILVNEGQEVSDSEYKKLAEQMAKDNEYETLKEYEEDFGEVYTKTQVAREKVIDLLYKSAKLKEVPYDEYYGEEEEDYEEDAEESAEEDSEAESEDEE